MDKAEDLLGSKIVKAESKYASRKFQLTIAVTVLSTVLLYLRLIDPNSWSTIVATVVVGYMAGNVGSEAVTKWKGSKG